MERLVRPVRLVAIVADFYFDEDVDADLAKLLTVRGHTTLTTKQANRLSAKDDEQLVTATDLGRVLITHDVGDYRLLCRVWRRLAQRWGIQADDHAGILVLPQKEVIPYYRTASEIHNLVSGATVVWGEFFFYHRSWGWVAGPDARV